MKAGAPKSRKPLLRRWGHATARFFRGVIMLNDTPQRIAMGAAIGLFFSIQPFVGSQMLASMIVCKLMRASVLASLPWTWVTNPLTVAPAYYAAYRLGALFFPSDKLVTYERVRQLGELAEGQHWIDNIMQGFTLLIDIALPLQIGCLIIGLVSAVAGFFVVRKVVNALQVRRLSRRSRWHATIPQPPTPGAIP